MIWVNFMFCIFLYSGVHDISVGTKVGSFSIVHYVCYVFHSFNRILLLGQFLAHSETFLLFFFFFTV